MRQYNQPTVSEIAAVIFDNSYIPEIRDIIIKTHENHLHHISELHGAYDPLQYPLLFPYGEYEWLGDILRANITELEPEPEPVIPMEIEEEREYEEARHTEATQDMENLYLNQYLKRLKASARQ